ncbi:cAMP-dependent protein kinase regulatory subunit [Colletotrichum sidae]|uniref:cAMP-dependent protein kinase regulatory subunit n=1 Tax=Colletotrichum sidae TaxID=1347389 RepID=A0A4R8TT45_9PEZI|nr:cAMP-dependent protein kinase regulatory subunit [Colletotrichum sidae]
MFKSPFGANANPFGGASDGATVGGNAMHQVIEEEENDTVTSPTSPNFGMNAQSMFSGPFGGDASDDVLPSALRSPPNPESYPAQYNFSRRTSVSAESLKPSADTYDNWTPPVHDKTNEQLSRLKTAIAGNFLFSHLDDEQSAQILGALIEKPIPAKDIKVISQGDAGDYFYVVEKGSFDVYVNEKGTLQPGPEGMGEKVGTIQAGGSFGELALMYNAPRAATVISAEPGCTLWALDRLTFRRILMESTFSRRRMYEDFLRDVPLLQTLTPYERSKIADALETQKYTPGATIIKEGDPGHSFYLLESGEADAYLGDGKESVKHYSKGDFFGELALLNDAPRAASIVATTDVKVASLGKSAFQRLLGPVEGIMRRTKYDDIKTGVEEMDPLQV